MVPLSFLRGSPPSASEAEPDRSVPSRQSVEQAVEWNTILGPLVESADEDEQRLIHELLTGVERVLGPRARQEVSANTVLTRQGDPIDAIHLVVEGLVVLRRDSQHGQVIAHHATSGPIIGLISLAHGETAFFTSVTTTPATIVRLTTGELQRALVAEPGLKLTLSTLAIKSLTRRLMRAEDLHIENVNLAVELEQERQKLADTLTALRATREELVERTRFAMLGELSAGIAHELNNPVTALVRAAEHLAEDVEGIVATVPQLAPALEALRAALSQGPRSTAEEREQIASIFETVGDRQFARRLVKAGITDQQRARDFVGSDGESKLRAVESGARVGASLRAVLAAGDRVIELTQSLKGYARPDAEELREVDVRDGLDDVLRLTRHRLRGIAVECQYDEVPLILAHPGKLQQVWTNLLVNAAEALDDEVEDGRHPARGEVPAQIKAYVGVKNDEVVVDIHDNGPGIPPELVDRIFEPHFTTKAGRVRFGLGMGMSISRSIVEDLGGRMQICSQPGDTTIRVRLPIGGGAGTLQGVIDDEEMQGKGE